MKHEARRGRKVRRSWKERKSKESDEMTHQELLEILSEVWPDVGEEDEEEFERDLERWVEGVEDLEEE